MVVRTNLEELTIPLIFPDDLFSETSAPGRWRVARTKIRREKALADFLFKRGIWGRFMPEPENTQSNYWLCSIALADRLSRDAFLEQTNAAGVMTRPTWRLIPHLAMYADCQTGPQENAQWLSDRIVNLPSGIRTNG